MTLVVSLSRRNTLNSFRSWWWFAFPRTSLPMYAKCFLSCASRNGQKSFRTNFHPLTRLFLVAIGERELTPVLARVTLVALR